MKSVSPRLTPPLRPLARRWLQIGLLIAMWFAADAAVRWLGWPIPGGVLGLLGLWLLLGLRWLPLSWVEQGADGILEHLLLFFIPAMLGVLNHPEFLSLLGVKIVFAVFIGTAIVMSGTAVLVEFCFRWRARRHVG